MQCVNCGFENIPGLKACVRCQSNLALDEVSVAPPRASGLRVGTSVRRWWNTARTAVTRITRVLPRWRRSTVDDYSIRWEAVVASIIPGLGHIRYGRKITGYLLLTVWGFLMIGALATLGLDQMQWFLSVAVAVHAFALMAFLGPQLTDSALLARAFFGILMFAGLRIGLYHPIGWLGERFYVPFPVAGIKPSAAVHDGDVFLCRGPWLKDRTFQRGDLVVYKTQELRGHYGHVRYAVGYGIDRVAGVPGDHVQITRGALLVNGQPLPPRESPLGSVANLDGLNTTCDDVYVIVPTLMPYETHGIRNPGEFINEISRVHRSNIVGKVAYRIQPWSRFGKVQ